ncbi:MAG: M42 family metallopeptidase [Firmicutes bacterium]|nr:M42 family metallopeptidase [Bacillota bacterium]
MDTQSVLHLLSVTPGPSGHERAVADRIAELFAPYCDEIRRDALGNVIAWKRGTGGGPKVMWAAHMDEIGLIVREVRPDGFLRVAPIGGMDARNIVAQEVVVHGRRDLPGIIGTKPPHLLTADQRDKVMPLHELFVDVGLDGTRAAELVRPGDVITLHREPLRLHGQRFSGKALDDRACVAAMWEGLKFLQGLRHEADVYAVATVQEEVGLRGAVTATFGIQPDVGIAIDVTFGDQPGVKKDDAADLGGGPDITRGANIHPGVFALLKQTAEAHGIPHQVSVAPAQTGTDAWAIQVTQAGVPTGLLSVPLRYMHSTVETVDMRDIRETGRLLAHFTAACSAAAARGWSHGE